MFSIVGIVLDLLKFYAIIQGSLSLPVYAKNTVFPGLSFISLSFSSHTQTILIPLLHTPFFLPYTHRHDRHTPSLNCHSTKVLLFTFLPQSFLLPFISAAEITNHLTDLSPLNLLTSIIPSNLNVQKIN